MSNFVVIGTSGSWSSFFACWLCCVFEHVCLTTSFSSGVCVTCISEVLTFGSCSVGWSRVLRPVLTDGDAGRSRGIYLTDAMSEGIS